MERQNLKGLTIELPSIGPKPLQYLVEEHNPKKGYIRTDRHGDRYGHSYHLLLQALYDEGVVYDPDLQRHFLVQPTPEGFVLTTP